VAEVRKEINSNSEWMRNWNDEMWNSTQWRTYLITIVEGLEKELFLLSEVRKVADALQAENEKQAKYIELLERQTVLLQKTLDIVERCAPTKIFMPERGEVIG